MCTVYKCRWMQSVKSDVFPFCLISFFFLFLHKPQLRSFTWKISYNRYCVKWHTVVIIINFWIFFTNGSQDGLRHSEICFCKVEWNKNSYAKKWVESINDFARPFLNKESFISKEIFPQFKHSSLNLKRPYYIPNLFISGFAIYPGF